MTDTASSEDLRLLVEAGLARGMNVVEFGCGSGALARLLARTVGPSGRVLGLDVSAFSVARARDLAAQEKLGNVLFEVADARDSRVASDFADVCLARHLLGWVPDPERVVKEMARVARPGGIVAVFEGDEGLVVYEPEPPALTELRNLLARQRLEAGGSRLVGRSLYRLLTQAGLANVRIVALTCNSTQPEWSASRDPASHTALLARAVDDLVEKGNLSREEAARYYRALEEVTKNPLSFVFVCSFFAHGRRPLRCA